MTPRRDPNRIVFILSQYGVGGAEKQLANLIFHRPDVARRLDVRTITFLPATSEDVASSFERAGATNTLVDRSSKSFPRFFWELVSVLRVIRPAIVSTILDSSVAAWGRLAALLTGVPVIVQSDLALNASGGRMHHLLRPYLDRHTARFLPNANAIATRLVESGVPRSKIRVMPNGVELSRFNPAAVSDSRSEWRIPFDATVLGYLGRFAPIKRIDLLLAALLRIDESDRPDYVLLAGDGPTMPDVKALVASDPWLEQRCRILGTINATPEFLATIDYLVLPSDSEGLPNVVLEAMAMGKPVVATRVSDIPTVIADSGILADPSDVVSMSNAILSMQQLGVQGRQSLGDRARLRVEEEYAMEVAADRFWRAHLELVRSELFGKSG